MTVRSGRGLLRGGVGALGGLAQSVGMTGPSAGIGIIMAAVIGVVGPTAWISWAIGIVGIGFVAGAVVFLSRRFSTTGGLFPLAGKAGGQPAGYFTAYATLLWLLVASPVVALQTGILFNAFLTLPAIHVAPSNTYVILVSFIAMVAAGGVAYSGIRISSVVLLVIEGVTISAIVLLMCITLVVHKGGIVDSTEFNVPGSNVGTIFTGLALVIFAYSGFESATVLGQEVRQGRRNIPVAVIGTVLVAGALFVFVSYTTVMGLDHSHYDIGASPDVLAYLAGVDGASWLGYVITIGVTLATFAGLIALYIALPRILYTLPREGLPGSRWLELTSRKHRTPAAALAFVLGLGVLAVAVIAVWGVDPVNAFADLGSLSGYGAAIMYICTGFGVVVFAIWRTKRSRPVLAAGGSLLGAAVMGYGLYRSLIPLPEYPLQTFVWIFVATAGLAVVGFGLLRVRHPQAFMGLSVDEDTGATLDHSEVGRG